MDIDIINKIKSLIDKGDEIIVYLPNQKFEELSKSLDNIQWTHGGRINTDNKGFHRKGIFIKSSGKDVHVAPLSDFNNICEKLKEVSQ